MSLATVIDHMLIKLERAMIGPIEKEKEKKIKNEGERNKISALVLSTAPYER